MSEPRDEDLDETAQPPTTPPSKEERSKLEGPDDSTLETYHTITGMVGGPSIRLRDNLVSLLGAVAGALMGALAGALTCGPNAVLPLAIAVSIPTLIGVGIGAVLGLVAGVFLAGLLLMVVGLARR